MVDRLVIASPSRCMWARWLLLCAMLDIPRGQRMEELVDEQSINDRIAAVVAEAKQTMGKANAIALIQVAKEAAAEATAAAAKEHELALETALADSATKAMAEVSAVMQRAEDAAASALAAARKEADDIRTALTKAAADEAERQSQTWHTAMSESSEKLARALREADELRAANVALKGQVEACEAGAGAKRWKLKDET